MAVVETRRRLYKSRLTTWHRQAAVRERSACRPGRGRPMAANNIYHSV